MSKGNLFLGMARGRVGSVVFSRRGGEQITRTYNARVANPKSVGQRQQRAIFSTVNRAAKYMRTVVDHSWGGVKSGAESVNYFVKKNVALLREQYSVGVGAVSLCSKGQEALMPNRYLMSEGSLPTQTVKVYYEESAGSNGGALLIGGWSFEDEEPSAADFFRVTGYKPGDQLSFVGIMGALDDAGYPVETRFVKRRYIFAQTIPDILIDTAGSFETQTLLFDPSSDNLALPRFVVVNGLVYICMGLAPSEALLSGCWILSRYDSVTKQWIYSTETMVCEPALESNAETAIASYDTEAAAPTSEEFLDGAIAGAEESLVNDGTELSYSISLYQEGDETWGVSGLLSQLIRDGGLVKLQRDRAAVADRLIVRIMSNRGWMVRAAKMVDMDWPNDTIARNIDTESLVEYNLEYTAGMLGKSYTVSTEAFMVGVGKHGPWLFEISVAAE